MSLSRSFVEAKSALKTSLLMFLGGGLATNFSPDCPSGCCVNFDLALFVCQGFRGLYELNGGTKKALIDLLSKKRLPGSVTWTQVARRYEIMRYRETEISLLDKEKVPAAALFQKLLSGRPNPTVYYLYETFNEADLKRLDCVDLLTRTENGDIHLQELLK